MVDKKQAAIEFMRFLRCLRIGMPDRWDFFIRLKNGEILVLKVEVEKRKSHLRLAEESD